ncbi:MAG TPA: SDR family oxidoreductase [Polyangiaceae bacterium]|jgi:NAD(P)-dependent dehydrogenase (short-subunit alcohol dehydrogenase family)|nr:SDR family oxidoreductase [Polyangiaceae bacterium]
MLSGKTALVTGGGRGIGRAIALALSAAGARVIVTGRSTTELAEVATRTGGASVVADLATRAGVEALIGWTLAETERVDILVNNAGIAESARLDKTTDEIWERTMAINSTAPFLLCRAFVPKMIAARWGRVINIASNAGRTGYAYTSAYCASKHALVGLTRALAVEVGASGVTVNAICPGWVKTDMAAAAAANIATKTKRSEEEAEATLAAMSPQRRLMEAEEVAHLVVALAEDGARGINGQAIPIDGGQVMA